MWRWWIWLRHIFFSDFASLHIFPFFFLAKVCEFLCGCLSPGRGGPGPTAHSPLGDGIRVMLLSIIHPCLRTWPWAGMADRLVLSSWAEALGVTRVPSTYPVAKSVAKGLARFFGGLAWAPKDRQLGRMGVVLAWMEHGACPIVLTMTRYNLGYRLWNGRFRPIAPGWGG